MHFCITGTGRSGTKLLRNLFNSHPDLYVYNETHWIPKMFEFFGTDIADVDMLIEIIKRTYHVLGMPVTELDEDWLSSLFANHSRLTVVEFCDRLSTAIAQQHGKRLWADKTPDYGPHLQTLQILWPQCKIVHLIRNGKEVALSMSHHPGFRWMASAHDMWWGSASFNQYYQAIEVNDRPFTDYLDLWYWRLLRIRNESERLHPNSYLEVQFEDLLEQSEPTLTKIAEFVKLPASTQWLAESNEIIDINHIRCHAENVADDVLEPYHRALLANLGYE